MYNHEYRYINLEIWLFISSWRILQEGVKGSFKGVWGAHKAGLELILLRPAWLFLQIGGSLLVGVLTIRPYYLRSKLYIRVPDFWKLAHGT